MSDTATNTATTAAPKAADAPKTTDKPPAPKEVTTAQGDKADQAEGQVAGLPKDTGEPAEVEGAKKGTYYVKAGQEHNYILDGDLKVAKEGDPVELTADQFKAFSDKFSKNKSEAVSDDEG
ncbi:hypothetical protein MAINES_00540 [Brevundimonas phage vB_BpoS-MaInes]|nr:hypothetical protein MAINES_00540 [Brevundimonas phage vB_BpoS-MaInes]